MSVVPVEARSYVHSAIAKASAANQPIRVRSSNAAAVSACRMTFSACTGSPGCARSLADVRADAARSLDPESAVHRHFVGCDRACGSPPDGEVLVATGDGYRARRAHP